jgi:hypothetical protein
VYGPKMNINTLAAVTGRLKKKPVSFEGLSGVQLTIPVFLDVMPHCSVSGYVLNEHTVFLLLGQVGQEE